MTFVTAAESDTGAVGTHQSPCIDIALYETRGVEDNGDVGTHQSPCIDIAALLGIVLATAFSGCGGSVAAPPADTATIDAGPLEIDAGVIFSDRHNYLVVPLSRLGLSGSESVESLISSCDCVKPSFVQYSDVPSTAADGVLLEFIPEERTALNAAESSMRLAVEVKLTMFSGDTRSFRVSFLRSLSTSSG